MSTEDLDRRLAAASRPVDPVDPAFADRLEQRLIAVHDTLDRAAPSRRVGNRGRFWVAPVMAAAVVLALVLIAFAAPADAPTDLAFDRAFDAQVHLPDGRVVDASEGLVLPDGTLIVAGLDVVVIGGVEIDPGESALVSDGRVISVPADSGPDQSAAPVTDRSFATSTSTTQATTRTTSTSVVSLPPTQVQPGPGPGPTAPTTAPTSTTTTTRPPPEVVELDLTARRGDGRRVELQWSAYPRADFDRYVVVRSSSETSGQPAGPSSPDSAKRVFTSQNQRTLTASDSVPDETKAVDYRVFVLDDAGRIIGRSAVVRVTFR